MLFLKIEGYFEIAVSKQPAFCLPLEVLKRHFAKMLSVQVSKEELCVNCHTLRITKRSQFPLTVMFSQQI